MVPDTFFCPIERLRPCKCGGSRGCDDEPVLRGARTSPPPAVLASHSGLRVTRGIGRAGDAHDHGPTGQSGEGALGGYVFHYPTLEPALRAIVAKG